MQLIYTLLYTTFFLDSVFNLTNFCPMVRIKAVPEVPLPPSHGDKRRGQTARTLLVSVRGSGKYLDRQDILLVSINLTYHLRSHGVRVVLLVGRSVGNEEYWIWFSDFSSLS